MGVSTRNTKQKRAVWGAFEEAQRPLSPLEVHQAVSRSLPSVSLATVYRILRSLEEEGNIVSVSLPGAPDRYETRACAERHHHHFFCDHCAKVFDIPGCGLKVDSHLAPGFLVRAHEVVLYGRCGECEGPSHSRVAQS